MKLKEYILNVIAERGIDSITLKTLTKKLNITSAYEVKALSDVLKTMEKEGLIAEINGRFVLVDNVKLIKGTIKRHERGFAFLIRDDKKPDLFIPPRKMGDAFQGDKVLARLTALNNVENGGDSDEAEVVKVIERGVNEVIGQYYAERGYGFVVPDDNGFGCDIYVGKGNDMFAKTGQKVLCKIISYPKRQAQNPEGKITAILGNPRNVETQVESILIKNKARCAFEDDVLKECESITEEISSEEIANREDLRDLLTITIDGDDAKDFDDAISIEKIGEEYNLYVHIADVTHYVKKGGAIDKEAYLRGTSIYMPGRVIPMLPEKLCNGVCSLNPNVDRLAITVKMTFDKNAVLTDKSVYKSIIKSNKRTTYKKVQACFDGDKDAIKEYSDIIELLKNAKELKDKMLIRRDEKGYVDLDVQDTLVYFDEDNQLIVDKRQGLESERIIEQFMISANVAVAEFVYYAEMPFIYRIHPEPESEKVESLCEFLKAVGVKISRKPKYPKEFQKLLTGIKDEPYFAVVNDVMLRTMQKAIYSPYNQGHFGLNEKCYCHFTSPIRRYPDLTVHRILKGILDGEAGEIFNYYSGKVEEIAFSCSENERKADLIERNVEDVYISKFMQQFIGDFFEGIISGVTSFGIFVRLENSVEGMIPMEYLPKDSYEYSKETYTLKGRKFTFKLGKPLLVKLVASNIETGKIDFALVRKFK